MEDFRPVPPDFWTGGGSVVILNNSYTSSGLTPSPFGTQYVILDSPGASISQNLPDFVAGQTYHFSLAVAGLFTGNGATAQVTLTGASNGVFDLTTTTNVWQVYGFDFVAASSGAINFTIANTFGPPRIDNAQISVVPEASTFAIVIVGLMLIVGLQLPIVRKRFGAAR